MRPPHWTHDRDCFYKYATCSTTKAILRDCKLRFSSPTLFNDPFDIQFDLHLEFEPSRVKSKILDQLWNAHYSEKPPPVGNELGAIIAQFRDSFPRFTRAEFEKEYSSAIDDGLAAIRMNARQTQIEYRKHLSNVKVLCLSEVRDSIPMWSHYSEQHAGAVLELRCVEELDSVFGIAAPVRYCEDMPRLFDEDFLVRMGSGQSSIDVREIFNTSAYSKAKDWAYEKEWRIVGGRSGAERSYEDNPFHRKELSTIYLGCRMSDENRFEIIDLATKNFPHAKIYQVEKHPSAFDLVFRELMPILARKA